MALQSAVGFSENIDESYEAGLEIGDVVLEKIDLRAHSVGILFCHIDFDFAELLRGIEEKLDIPIIGCTTSGEANDQGFFEESASLMVLTADDVEFGLGIGQNLSKDSEKAVQMAYESAKAVLGDDKPKLALTFPDKVLSLAGEHILSLLEQRLDKGVPVVGGLAGDNLQLKKTYQFLNHEVYSDAIPLLLLSGNIEPLVITRSGWIPMGKRAKATKVQGNVLLEIDHQPAIEYLKKYNPDVDDPLVMASYPIALLDESLGDEAGRYFVVRGSFQYNKENGAVFYQGDIPENATIQLARGSREDILAGSADAITTLMEKSAGRELHTLLCFSCAGRKLMLGLDTKKEIELILNDLPANCAVNGFYTDGEIGPIDSSVEHLKKNRFHNTTLVLCGF
ncbi:MAG: FIST signal transduction protein [bacterium]